MSENNQEYDPIYIYYHEAMPYWLAHSPQFVYSFGQQGPHMYYESMKFVYDQAGQEFPYKEEDFTVNRIKYEQTYIVQLRGIGEHKDGHCADCFLFLNLETNELKYFLTEYRHNPITNEETYRFSEYDKDGKYTVFDNRTDLQIYEQAVVYAIRFFLAIFIKSNAKIPLYFVLEDIESHPENYGDLLVWVCADCEKGIVADATNIAPDDEVLFFCPECGHIDIDHPKLIFRDQTGSKPTQLLS